MSKVLSASKALIVDNNKFLLIKAIIGDFHYWGLPGGKVDYGESPFETVKREVKEEIYIDVEVEKVVGVFWFYRKKDKNQVVCTTYLCNTENNEIDLTKNPCVTENIQEYKWVSKDEFLNGDYQVSDESLKEMVRGFDFLG